MAQMVIGSDIVNKYNIVKQKVIERGYKAEISWQDGIQFSKITESDFLSEAAWVVLSSGMREAVIRGKFPEITKAFCNWKSAKQIVKNSKECRKKALAVFGHKLKIEAIITIAKIVSETGFESFKEQILIEDIEFIQTLPFMGKATSYHLAKNIGLDVVKPDRHLVRVAEATGYNSPLMLCEEISRIVGDRVSVIDIVIWRFATLYPDYVDYFSN